MMNRMFFHTVRKYPWDNPGDPNPKFFAMAFKCIKDIIEDDEGYPYDSDSPETEFLIDALGVFTDNLRKQKEKANDSLRIIFDLNQGHGYEDKLAKLGEHKGDFKVPDDVLKTLALANYDSVQWIQAYLWMMAPLVGVGWDDSDTMVVLQRPIGYYDKDLAGIWLSLQKVKEVMNKYSGPALNGENTHVKKLRKYYQMLRDLFNEARGQLEESPDPKSPGKIQAPPKLAKKGVHWFKSDLLGKRKAEEASPSESTPKKGKKLAPKKLEPQPSTSQETTPALTKSQCKIVAKMTYDKMDPKLIKMYIDSCRNNPPFEEEEICLISDSEEETEKTELNLSAETIKAPASPSSQDLDGPMVINDTNFARTVLKWSDEKTTSPIPDQPDSLTDKPDGITIGLINVTNGSSISNRAAARGGKCTPGKKGCIGCEIDHPSQKHHMGPGGCLNSDSE